MKARAADRLLFAAAICEENGEEFASGEMRLVAQQLQAEQDTLLAWITAREELHKSNAVLAILRELRAVLERR